MDMEDLGQSVAGRLGALRPPIGSARPRRDRRLCCASAHIRRWTMLPRRPSRYASEPSS